MKIGHFSRPLCDGYVHATYARIVYIPLAGAESLLGAAFIAWELTLE